MIIYLSILVISLKDNIVIKNNNNKWLLYKRCPENIGTHFIKSKKC